VGIEEGDSRFEVGGILEARKGKDNRTASFEIIIEYRTILRVYRKKLLLAIDLEGE
jgi:hypothetical protein